LLLEGEPPAGSLAFAAEVLNAEPNFARHSQLVNLQAGTSSLGDHPHRSADQHGVEGAGSDPEDRAYFFDEPTEARIKAAE